MSARKYNSKKPNKQDLIAAREELKKFRHDVAQLKKKGLIDKARYDARKVLNSGQTGKYLKSQIKKFSNVLSGSATTAKVSKEKAAYYKKKGYSVKNGRVIVPVSKGEKITVSHGNFTTRTTHPSGKITRIDLGFDADSIPEFIEGLKNKKIKLKKDERIAFSFFGNNSHRTARDIEDLLDYLSFYQTFSDAEDSGNPDEEKQVIDNIIIYKVERSDAWERTPFHGTEKHEKQKERNRKIREKWFQRLTQSEYDRYMDKRAEYARKRREKLKLNPSKYEAEKLKARERAQKSYHKRHPKK